MSDSIASDVEPKDSVGAPAEAPPWLRATAADLRDLDFESPIAGSTSADTRELSDQFLAAMQPADKTAQLPDTAATRVFNMLSAVTGMHFKPAEPNEPFGPRITFADRRWFAIPSDFRGAHVDLLAEMANRAKSPVLRARLADVCWSLDQKRWNLGSLAIGAYAEIVQKTDSGELKFPFYKAGGALHPPARDYLRRALQIGRAIGWDKEETIAAREAVILLRRRATELRALVPVLWFSELDLDLGVSDPAEVAAAVDEVLAVPSADADSHFVVGFGGLLLAPITSPKKMRMNIAVSPRQPNALYPTRKPISWG